jgi:hypothetical protein
MRTGIEAALKQFHGQLVSGHLNRPGFSGDPRS